MFNILNDIRDDISGATAVEYGLILALIFLALVSAVENVGTEINSTWNNVSSKVSESSDKARGG
ncbi:Flp family type IVb pilin [Altererythrobacter sp. MF3-039]|uniref:Flp family type IVb pilin n=1 Tax=Altererythrobacter sp. MF3-039 TaxID=3252901 RepID=UPI00390C65A2